jgi:hypothetical protein
MGMRKYDMKEVPYIQRLQEVYGLSKLNLNLKL